MSQHDLSPEASFVVSGAIDIVKVALLLLAITAVLARAFVSNRASD